jgi:hypothetical protein
MTAHVAIARRRRGKGLRSRAARQRKQELGQRSSPKAQDRSGDAGREQ